MSWITALFLAAWPYSYSFLKAPKALLRVLSAKVANPFSNLEAFKKAALSFLSGKVWIFLKAMTTRPALDIRSLFKKFLWISVILLLSLNLLMAYLIWAVFPVVNNPLRTLSNDSFCWLFILSLSFSMLLTSLHLLKQSLMLPDKFLNNWIKAFSLRAESLLSTKARSATDLIAKLRVWNKAVICLH